MVRWLTDRVVEEGVNNDKGGPTNAPFEKQNRN